MNERDKDAQRSKSGKTILRIAKSGRQYWYNPVKAEAEKERVRELRNTGKVYNQPRLPKPYAPKSESYMKYFERKLKIAEQFPDTQTRTLEEHKQYINQLLELILTDKDLRYYLEVESETEQQRLKRERFERKRDEDYDGMNAEYR